MIFQRVSCNVYAILMQCVFFFFHNVYHWHQDLEQVFKTPAAQHLVRTEKIENTETKRVTQIAFQLKS